MVRKLPVLAIVLFALIVAPLVFAATDINVKTLPEHKVSIFVLKTEEAYSLLDSFHNLSDASGMFNVVYSGESGLIDIGAEVTKDGADVVAYQRFEDFNAGSGIYLQLIPGNVLRDYNQVEVELEEVNSSEEEQPVEENVSEEAPAESEEVNTEAGVTGSAISEEEDSEGGLSNMTYFIIGGVLLAVVVLMFILKMTLPSLRRDLAYKYQRLHSSGITSQERKLEGRLIEAQKEIARLKKKEENIKKIADVQIRLERDQEELRKLRSEY